MEETEADSIVGEIIIIETVNKEMIEMSEETGMIEIIGQMVEVFEMIKWMKDSIIIQEIEIEEMIEISKDNLLIKQDQEIKKILIYKTTI